LDAVGKCEAPLELTRRDTAVEVILGELLALLAADDKLSVFDADLELIEPEACYGKGDAQRLSVPQQLDVVGRVASITRLCAPTRGALGRKGEPEIAFEKRHARHQAKALFSEAAAQVAYSRP